MALTTGDSYRSAILLLGRSSTIHEQSILCIYSIWIKLYNQKNELIVSVLPRCIQPYKSLEGWLHTHDTPITATYKLNAKLIWNSSLIVPS
jgi:hypothetical protein